MDSIAQRQAQRTCLLLAVYERTDGRVSAEVDVYEVGQVLELTGDQTRGVVEYLVNEDLLEFRRYRNFGSSEESMGVIVCSRGCLIAFGGKALR